MIHNHSTKITSIPSLQNEEGGALVTQINNSVIVDLSIVLPYGELARLCRGIETALPDLPNRVVQFVSAYAGEGSSTIAFETAVIAAQMMGKKGIIH